MIEVLEAYVWTIGDAGVWVEAGDDWARLQWSWVLGHNFAVAGYLGEVKRTTWDNAWSHADDYYCRGMP